MKSFRQVYTELGENRTTVQYWIDKILCRPKQDERDNTPLQFTPEEVRQLWVIKLYRELGYSNSEIRAIINGEDFDFEKAYDEHIDKLRREKERLEKMIGVAAYMKKSFITPDTLGMDFFGGMIDCEDSISLMTKFSASKKNTIYLSDEVFDTFDGIFSSLVSLSQKNISPDSPEAMELVAKLQEKMIEHVGNFTFSFRWIFVDFLNNPKEKRRIDEKLGKGSTKYVLDALLHFCNNNKTENDQKLEDLLNELALLFKDGRNTEEIPVQNVIRELDELFLPLQIYNSFLQGMANILDHEVYVKLFKTIDLDGFSVFFKSAIDHYLKK